MIVKMMEKPAPDSRVSHDLFSLIDGVGTATIEHPPEAARPTINLFFPEALGRPARSEVYGIFAPVYFMNDEGKTVDSFSPPPEGLACPITNQADFEYQFRLEKGTINYNAPAGKSLSGGGDGSGGGWEGGGGAGGSGGTYILSMADPSGQILFRRDVGALVKRIREQEQGIDDASSAMHVLIPIVRRLLNEPVSMVTAWL